MKKKTPKDSFMPIQQQDWESCVHCGICLSTCPSYLVSQDETLSPRGRVYMLKNFVQGKFTDRKHLNKVLQTCLDCGECVKTCPNGVQPNELVTKFRAEQAMLSGLKIWQSWLLHDVFISPARLHKVFKALRSALPLSFILPVTFINNARSNFPDVPDLVFSELLKEGLYRSERKAGTPLGEVLFFEGCVMGALLPEKSLATVELLRLLGWNVRVQKQDGCCGALQLDLGDFKSSKKLAEAQLNSIDIDSIDYVVTDCAGCLKMLSRYATLFFTEGALLRKAQKLNKKTRHLLDMIPVELFSEDDTFHRPCQYDEPIRKNKVGNKTVVEFHKGKTACCGSAGIYSVLEKDISEKITSRAKDELLKNSSGTIVVSNPGCYFTLKKALSAEGKVEFLSSYFLDKLSIKHGRVGQACKKQ